MPHPETAVGIPRCELYLYADEIESAFRHAMDSGAQLISPVTESDWGNTVCYFAYPDGHIMAFAKKKQLAILNLVIGDFYLKNAFIREIYNLKNSFLISSRVFL